MSTETFFALQAAPVAAAWAQFRAFADRVNYGTYESGLTCDVLRVMQDGVDYFEHHCRPVDVTTVTSSSLAYYVGELLSKGTERTEAFVSLLAVVDLLGWAQLKGLRGPVYWGDALKVLDEHREGEQ